MQESWIKSREHEHRQNNAILQRLDQKGNIKPFSGGNVILQEIMYNDPLIAGGLLH
jgi:hypothetical protein